MHAIYHFETGAADQAPRGRGWKMQMPMFSLALCTMAALFAMMVARAFEDDGRQKTRRRQAVAKTINPLAFWFAQAAKLFVMLACLSGAFIAVNGL
jgi:alkylation response protein AidB-like acyl-CoA dehydrogenase